MDLIGHHFVLCPGKGTYPLDQSDFSTPLFKKSQNFVVSTITIKLLLRPHCNFVWIQRHYMLKTFIFRVLNERSQLGQ